jgi:hypothetical protein
MGTPLRVIINDVSTLTYIKTVFSAAEQPLCAHEYTLYICRCRLRCTKSGFSRRCLLVKNVCPMGHNASFIAAAASFKIATGNYPYIRMRTADETLRIEIN